MNKKLATILLLSPLLIMGCNNTATTPNNTTPPSNTNTSQSSSNMYTTENIVITNANDALERLKEGNKRFVEDKSQLQNVTSERRNQLESGQQPYAVIVSCSDSRVTPTTVFDCGLGEIFDIRIAGNVVDKDALGSIEYGVEHLHSPLVVVMGHEKCGAVTAAYDKLKNGTEVEGNINSIVDKIIPNIDDSDDLNEAIHDNIESVHEQILEDPIVKELVHQDKLKVVKAYYSLDGKVTFD